MFTDILISKNTHAAFHFHNYRTKKVHNSECVLFPCLFLHAQYDVIAISMWRGGGMSTFDPIVS